MAKLLKRTKAIVSKSRASGTLTGQQAHRLRRELRSSGVSDVERKLRKTVTSQALNGGQRKAYREQFRKQARVSASSDGQARAKMPHLRNVK